MGQLLMQPTGNVSNPPSRQTNPPSRMSNPPSRASAASSFDLLGEAQQLMSMPQPNLPLRRKVLQPAPSVQRQDSHEPPAAAQPEGPSVDTLPTDWALKRGCLVTSLSSLEWCSAPTAAVRAHALGAYAEAESRSLPPAMDNMRGMGARDNAALALALERALVHWRHPAQRLPPLLLKQLSAPALGAAEKDYAEALNHQWVASLRALWAALRDGRLPYFYCRAEPPNPREPSVAGGSGFTVFWRNSAIPDVADGSLGERDVPLNANHKAPLLPLGWAASEEASCYAVLSPSSRGLRQALARNNVAFQMPLAPASMREFSDSIQEGFYPFPRRGGAGGGAGGGGPSGICVEESQLGGDSTPGRDDAATLAQLNKGRTNGMVEVQPDSVDGMQHQLATLDYKTGSTLVVHGRAACHALHEFLINHRPSPQPYFLTLQLLAPMPFVNGSAYAPRVVHTAGRRADTTAAAATSARGPHANGDTEPPWGADETIRLEDAERSGGALILPGALRQLTALLRRTQPSGFHVAIQPDMGGASSDALNCVPSKPPVTPLDLLKTVPVRRGQPQAKLCFPGEEPTDRPADDERREYVEKEEAEMARTKPKPTCIRNVRCYGDGALHLV